MSGKRSEMTLDLNSGPSANKKAKLAQVLTSPDVQMLKLTSPELADFLTRNPSLATPTPSGATGAPSASGYVFPKNVTEEQEMYAKGFEEALKNLHKSNNGGGGGGGGGENEKVVGNNSSNNSSSSSNIDTAILTIERATSAHRNTLHNNTLPPPQQSIESANLSRPSSGASGSFDSSSLDGSYILPDGVQVKEEPGINTSSTGVEPINLESQEKIKLERKRLRNRVAASKCRKRKLERISQLDDKVQMLKGENSELAAVVKKLKETVCNLKQEVIEHLQSGCDIMMTPEISSFNNESN